MQVNKYLDIFGGVTKENIPSGRMVRLVSTKAESWGGQGEGTYGVMLPKSADEAKTARFCIDWTPTNMSAPYFSTIPQEEWALRGGWDKDANTPFATVYSQTYWGDYEDYVIPSGTLVRIFNQGAVLTVASGQFIPDNLVQGCFLQVEHSGADAGKLKYSDGSTDPVVAMTEWFDADEMRLTFRIL